MRWISACCVILLGTVIFCEYLADFLVLQKCKWPQIRRQKSDEQPLRAMIIADPHLLGPNRGRWLDKAYREWHMKGAFQAAIWHLNPEVVFVLGDLFDEGDLVNDRQFQDYVLRYHQIFNLPAGKPMISILGNQDVGYHRSMHPKFLTRFDKNLNFSMVNLFTIKQIHFVLINSMALERDGCIFCNLAEHALGNISHILDCMKHPLVEECDRAMRFPYSRPIVMQHFPTYRKLDTACRDRDAFETEFFNESKHMLSKNATQLLGKLLKPRLAFAGHTHRYCHTINLLDIDEFTVSAFTWRYNWNPSFMMASITMDDYAISKCTMLPQPLVFNCYTCAGLVCLVILAIRHLKLSTKKKRRDNKHRKRD